MNNQIYKALIIEPNGIDAKIEIFQLTLDDYINAVDLKKQFSIKDITSNVLKFAKLMYLYDFKNIKFGKLEDAAEKFNEEKYIECVECSIDVLSKTEHQYMLMAITLIKEGIEVDETFMEEVIFSFLGVEVVPC